MSFPLLLVLALQGPLQAPPQAPVAPAPSQDAAAADLARAEQRYRAAIAITPGIGAYHESLALVLERQNRLEEALAEHRRAVELDPGAVRNRVGLAQLLVRMHREDEAASQLKEARKLDTLNPAVNATLAEIEATQDGQGYHDYSAFDDDQQRGWAVRRAIEWVFATILGISALALLAPIAGALLLALVQLPRHWRRGTIA